MDYDKLKFKCGLEIHQQLDTHKLFCECPSLLRKDEPDKIVKRKLHAVAGEAGEVDIAAEYQAGLGKKFIYQGYDTTCLVELDEEPPHEINKEALKTALQIAILLNVKILPIVQIMRKTVIDGSNTSGFQRTVLIGLNGYVETEQGRIGIDSIALEEDAARIVSREKDKVIFRLDRLGIPLVEITTSPDIKTPEQAKEVALHLGNILRSLKVKRGIGTIRQDVNISIRNENRVEMKGMQNMKIFLKAIEMEVARQKKLSDSGKPTESEVRNVLVDGSSEFLRPMPGAARMYPETDLPLLKISRQMVNEAKKDMPKLRGEIEEELKKKGLKEEQIKTLFKQDKLEEFKELLNVFDNANLIFNMVCLYPKELAKKTGKEVGKILKIFGDVYTDVLKLLRKGKISEKDVKIVLGGLAEGKKLEEALKVEKVEAGDVEERIMKLIKEKPGLSANAYMGLVMKEFSGKVDGGVVMEIIKKYVK